MKKNSQPFIHSRLFWYLFLSESKSSFVSSSTSSLIIISMWSDFECITRSSSLSMEKIKLFNTINWIFHLSDFLRLFVMSFKYGLILLRYSSTDGILFLSLFFGIQYNFPQKITYSYWFIIIFFFFMLKKMLNISEYPVFNCFSFFFKSKKISYVI